MRTSTSPPNGGGESVSAFDRLWTPAELAELWQLSEQSIRRLFIDVPGVFKIGENNQRGKRSYVTLRIQAQVVERIFRERSR